MATMRLTPLQKTVLTIAAPAVTELILTSLTQMVDTVMVGRLGAYAIAAVGLTSQPRFVMLGIFTAFNVGATAMVARFRGQNSKAEADIVTSQTMLLSVAAAALLTVPGVLFAGSMVRFMGAEADTVQAATQYFTILMLGLIPTVLPIAISALLRGVGETLIPLRYNITANGVNILFNYLLIYGKFGFPALGVRGAALATVIGHCAASAMALAAILAGSGKAGGRRIGRNRSDFLRLPLKKLRMMPDRLMLSRIVRIGIPAAGEQGAIRIGLLIYTITVAGLGTSIFAAHQIVLTILNLAFVNGQAFGMAASALTGQALGRGDPEGARAAGKASQRMGMLVSSFLGLCMFLGRHSLIGFFTQDSSIIALGAEALIIAALIQPFQSSFQIYAGALRGAGDSLYPALSMAVGILAVRPALSGILILRLGWGLRGAWIALFMDQVTRFYLIMMRYRKGRWTRIRV